MCERNTRALDLEGRYILTTTLLAADDNRAILDHLQTMLEKEKDYEVIAAISDGTMVVHECLRLRPAVILLDVSLGNVSGIDIARQLRDSGCSAKIVFVTVHEDIDYMNAAIGAGGAAYVVKSRLSLDLLTAIRAVLSGKLFISSGLLHQPR